MNDKELGTKSSDDRAASASSTGNAQLLNEAPADEEQLPATTDSETSPKARGSSVRQIEANRRNALHSTGPTTPEGRRASRKNALKHGLRAKEVIIPGLEDPKDFEAMMKELYEDWKPEGHTEHRLVEQIGVDGWRLRRVHRAELGAVRTQLATAMKSSSAEAQIEEAVESLDGSLPDILQQSTLGVSYLRSAVEQALNELESEGAISEASIGYIESFFGMESDTATILWNFYREEQPEENEETEGNEGNEGNEQNEQNEEDSESDGESFVPWTRANKKAARKHLETTLDDLDRLERRLRKQEKVELEIAQQRLSIPNGPELETIQRYETAIMRNLHRNIDLLERLQRRRRGEPPPPTVNVNVESG